MKSITLLNSRMRLHELAQRSVMSGERPNVNSLGQPIAHTPDGLRNFWNWFGNSKVVDKQGRPLVVYHGTKNDFRSFDPDRSNRQGKLPIEYNPSFFFTNSPDVAQSYANQKTHDWGFESEADWQRWERLVLSGKPENDAAATALWKQRAVPRARRWGEGGQVMLAYLRMMRPLRAAGRGWNWSEIRYKDDDYSTRDLIELAISKGHDGIIVTNVHDRGNGKGKPSTVYAVFQPNQIKSAIGNSGAFASGSDMIDETSGR